MLQASALFAPGIDSGPRNLHYWDSDIPSVPNCRDNRAPSRNSRRSSSFLQTR